MEPDKQTNILQQKNLSKSYSSDNCLSGGGSPMESSPHNHLPTSSELKWLNSLQQGKEKNADLTAAWSWNKCQAKIEHIKAKLKSCDKIGFAYIKCRRCGNAVEKDGQKRKFLLTCLLTACQNPECIKNRTRVLNNWFNSFKIYSKKGYHWTLNFPPVSKITNEIRKKYDQLADKFIKSFSSVNSFWARDINKSETGLRIHYHVFSFGWKGVRLPGNVIQPRIKEFSRREKVVCNTTLIGYRDKKSVFDYLSKRAGGVFGHESKGTDLGYLDEMSIEEYADVFYNKRKIWFFLKNVRREATELITLLTGEIENCAYCGYNHFKIIPKDIFKPPPDKTCGGCGLKVDPKDWNYQQGICVFCNSSAHSIRYPPAKEYERTQFIVSRLLM